MNYKTNVKQLNLLERRKSETNIIYAHEKRCIFCGETEDTREFKGKFVCANCIEYVCEELNLSNN